MIGRAGRPQYDDAGKVIILTSDKQMVRIISVTRIRMTYIFVVYFGCFYIV